MAPKRKVSPAKAVERAKRAALRDLEREIHRALNAGILPEEILNLVHDMTDEPNTHVDVENGAHDTTGL